MIARGPRTLKRTCDRILAKIEAQPKPTPEEIEQRRKQRAAEEENLVLSQRAMHWNDLIAERGKRYNDCRLSNFVVTNEKQKQVVDELRTYCESMRDNVEAGRGIVLFGPAGTGKDHFMMALARVAICNDIGVSWENGMDFFATVRDSFGRDDGETEAELIRYLTKPEILILSDPLPPAGKLTEFQTNVLFRAIDYRYSRCQPMWVTLNCTGRKEADERMGAQNMDRLIHGSLKLFCDWESYRD